MSVHTAAAGLSLALLAAAGVADTVERRVAADAHGQVDIVNVAGTVEVRGWNRAEVEVSAELSSSQRLEFENDGRHTLVKVVVPSGRKSSSSADLIVRVPENSAVSISTVSADQSIRNVQGSQRLQSVSGQIETTVWSDDLKIKTISGEVRVEGHKTMSVADISSVSGSVTLSGLSGEIQLETVSGDAQVRMGELTRGRLRTTSGTVDWRARLARDARLDAEAISGDLKFRLDGKIDAEFDIETFNGEIDNCFGPEAKRTREFTPGLSVRFVQGEGGARVGIKTMNGGVQVCNR
jgi:DUF4097 and DUF4098 domain-containing protein YvlB